MSAAIELYRQCLTKEGRFTDLTILTFIARIVNSSKHDGIVVLVQLPTKMEHHDDINPELKKLSTRKWRLPATIPRLIHTSWVPINVERFDKYLPFLKDLILDSTLVVKCVVCFGMKLSDLVYTKILQKNDKVVFIFEISTDLEANNFTFNQLIPNFTAEAKR
jgi:hypothetical protein